MNIFLIRLVTLSWRKLPIGSVEVMAVFGGGCGGMIILKLGITKDISQLQNLQNILVVLTTGYASYCWMG